MIRPALTEILLFAAPFAAYALFLAATRAGVLDPNSWSWRVVVSLTVVAILLTIGGFAMLRQRNVHPEGTKYVPPHMENGRVVPGQFK
jgi:predicted small integral membrane protein